MHGKSISWLVFGAAGLLALAAGVLWLVLSGSLEEDAIHERGGDRSHSSLPKDSNEEAEPLHVEIESREEAGSRLEREPLPAEQHPPVRDLESGKTLFSGRAIDTSTGKPVTAYVLSLRLIKKSDGRLMRPVPPWRRESIVSPEGRFSIPLDEGGTYVLRYEAPGYQRPDHRRVEIPDGKGIAEYLLEFMPGLTMKGRVVEEATGAPVAGAEVIPMMIRSIREQGGKDRAETWTDGEPSRTNAAGRFTVKDLREGPHRLWARHPDFAESFADGETGGGEVEIMLREGSRFFGLVRDAEGQPAPGADLDYYSMNISMVRHVSTGPDGRYTTPPLPPGSYTLSLTPAKDGGREAGKVLHEMQRADLADHDVEVNFGPRPGQVVWRGRLFDGEGTPVAGAKITLKRQFDYGKRSSEHDPKSVLCRSNTDKRGAFEIGPFDPGTYDADVHLPENTLTLTYYPVDRIVFDEPGLIVRDLHLRRTELSGVVIEERTGAPWRNSGGFVMACSRTGKIFTTSVDGEGRFRFRSLPPGTYFLSADGPDVSQGHLNNIVLAENGVIDDLRIVLPLSGTLALRVTGLDKIRNRNLSVKIRSADGDRSSTISGSGCVVDNRGVCTLTINWKAGSWKIILSHKAIGRAEKFFTIRAGETTRIEIDRSAFSPRRENP